MIARAVGTGLGSALALLAYLVWPTWENRRIWPALADMADSYRKYFLAVLDDATRVRAEIRRAARSARTNAQASLDRLRNEPRRNRADVAKAEGVFANANRFIRAAMALEAIRQHEGPIPAHDEIRDFSQRVDANLHIVIGDLREQTSTRPDATTLRNAQTKLVHALNRSSADSDDVQIAAWIDASDRITDSVDTLTHVLRQKS
jgi:uncharacterized membrane protein YccC